MARRLFLILLLISVQSFAQQTAIFVDPESQYRTGLDLFVKQKYAAAQKEFFSVAKSDKNISSNTRGNAVYYAAKCAAELFHKDAEYLLVTFINDYPENVNLQSAVYDLGLFYYRSKTYKKAIEWFEKVDQSDLAVEKKDEINFKLGYAFYMTNDYDKASKAFYKMKDGDSKYASAAQYYYAHMAYVNENYATALEGFNKLKNSEAFAPVVPYYITQIYYKQGRYDEVMKYAPSVLDTVNAKNGLEISRMLAESYYRKDDFKNAIPFLLDYENNSPNAGRQDDYELGFSYYRTGDYEKAIPFLQKVTTVADSLGQNAYYHLADCYLKSNNKRSARTSFQSAAGMKFDPVITEEAAFNYGKLSYELSYQSAALESFRNFVKNYPTSSYADQANEMLISLYSGTKNYKDALVALEGIKNQTPGLKASYQKVAYYRGVEFFMDNKSDDAVKLFNTSLQYPIDQNIVANASYWKGEALYKIANYDGAIRAYNDFQQTPAAVKSKNYNLSNYNVGYSNFKKENYADAQTAFRKYIRTKEDTDPTRFNDALLRIADCFFMLRDQVNALDYYNQAIAAGAKSSDYAIYQKSVILGIQGKMAEKVSSLQKLFDKYPKSVYYDDGLYEAGQASMILGNYDEALNYFRKIITDYPTGSYLRKAESGEALVYYNTKQDEKAMTAYKKIITKYPNTNESKEALVQIKNISVSQNKVDDYVEYVKSVPNADVSVAAQDSLAYEAAELLYTQGNCTDAVKDFNKYLDRYPNAIYKLDANYYRSDCQYRNKQYDDALVGYEFIISQSKNQFTEKSLLNAAAINYYRKAYDKALTQYEKLEEVAEVKDNISAAILGEMRSSYRLANMQKAQANAQKIIANSSDKDLINEAHLINGKAYLEGADMASAKSELLIVAKRTNSEMTAESKYLLATIEYKMSNYKESQKIIFEIQKQVPSYDFWIAKGFILLGDNYIAQKDTFQAKETYKSIITNYEKDPADPEDLKTIAQEKLSALTAVDDQKNKESIERKLRQNNTPDDSTNIIEPKK